MSQKAFDKVAKRVASLLWEGKSINPRLLKRWANCLLKASKAHHKGNTGITPKGRRMVFKAGTTVYGKKG